MSRAACTKSALLMVGVLSACQEQGFSKVTDAYGADGPQIEVTPTYLEFGELDDDDDAVVRTFTITSVGESPLEVSGVEISGPESGFTILSSETAFTLAPGDSQDIEVAFSPIGAYEQTANAVVSSDDADDPRVPVELLGAGLVPELMIDPDPLDFGVTYIGCDKDNTIDLVNVGNATLNISDYAFGGGDEFEVLSGPTMPVSLEEGESVSIYVTFTPSDEDVFDSTLAVTSNEPLGTRTGTQLGEGMFGAEYEDVFEIPEEPPVDIMFMIDQSCSMDEEQAALASNFATFISDLATYSADWQIIVANDEYGCNSSGILTASAPSYESRFQAAVMAGDGERYFEDDQEALLTPASRAIDNTDTGECNAGFMRDDALLHIVLVSDEREQSSATWSTLVNQIIAKKGDDSLVKISAIAGPMPTGCATAEAGTGYYEAANYTGGEFLSICSSWGSHMEDLADASVEMDTFELTHNPLESTIEVFINGTTRPDSEWDYNPTTNAVEFNVTPREGDTVTVTYGGSVTCD